MRKYLLIMVLTLALGACSKDEDEPVNENKFIDTSWTAKDDIASFVYGSGCTTTIEFVSESTCQEIDYRPNGIFSGTFVEEGTYSIKGDSVTWIVDGSTMKGKAVGSILTTTMGTINGGKRIYSKN